MDVVLSITGTTCDLVVAVPKGASATVANSSLWIHNAANPILLRRAISYL